MATDQERAQELYDQLKPEAIAVAIDHITSRVPPELQDEVKAIAEADLEAGEGGGESELSDSQVILNSGDSVRVVMAIGGDVPGSPGTAAIVGGALSFVQLQAVTGQSQDQSRRPPQPQRQTTPRR